VVVSGERMDIGGREKEEGFNERLDESDRSKEGIWSAEEAGDEAYLGMNGFATAER
jgi:hypothetical protein